jgi:uncharacterized protein YqgC (DUF456 family)
VKPLLWTLSILLVLAGTAGTVVPVLPGVPLVFGGLLIAAWIDGFKEVGAGPLVVLGILTLLSLLADIAASVYGARRVKASREAVWGAVAGTLIGLFAGLPGIIFGPFIGAAAGELYARRDLRRAGTVGLATWLGMVFAAAAKLALCFLMVAIFVTAYIWK